MRTTPDSLFTYLPGGGELQIERASDDEMTGTFVVEIAALHVVSPDDWPPPFEDGADSISASYPDDFPGRFEVFTDPLTLEGAFTAASPRER